MSDFNSYHEVSLASGDNVEVFLKLLCEDLDEKFKELSAKAFQQKKENY
ncbi:MAG: hypothetical protein ACTSSH_03880 [Candidatus Heimdallarchaeota archaeon]